MTVLLVGAGPGDPDLLTLRAEAVLATAAVVVTDAALVPLATAFAPRARVVAAPADLPALAAAGAGALVRLYRGDPWLHPDHAGEAAKLAARGIPTESVPGPPVETALAGAAGVPVHHRPLAVTVTLGPCAAADPGRTMAAEVPDLAAAATALGPVAAVAGGVAHRRPLDHLSGVPGLLVVGDVTRASADRPVEAE